MSSLLLEPAKSWAESTATPWSYEEAFARNLGLISHEEQQRLRTSRVAIAGMGGVGGIHAVTLARMGVGRFTLADPDFFESANTNRQYGATLSNCGRSKADVMTAVLRDINPEADVRIIKERIDASNAEEFLADAQLFLDGLDFFAIRARRHLFRLAAQQHIYGLTAAPLGLSTAWLTFAPGGMSFDRYFDLSDSDDEISMLAAFAVGLAPRATHLTYMDLGRVNLASGAAPSCGAACQLAAGVIAIESLKVLLGRPGLRPAPCYQQFDAYRGLFRAGRLTKGNRHLVQRLKRKWLVRRFNPKPCPR